MSNIIHLSNFAGRSILAPTLFGALREGLRSKLMATAPKREFSDRQLIQQQGDTAEGFWVIETGRVLVGQYIESGEFRAVAQLAVGDSYGELAVLAEQVRIVDAIASGPATMRWISANGYKAALAEDPASMQQLTKALAQQLQELIGATTHARYGTVSARIASLLLNLLGPGKHYGTVRIGQQRIADLLGVTRATVNKGLAELENDGLIERGYRAIDIRDATRLRAAASHR